MSISLTAHAASCCTFSIADFASRFDVAITAFLLQWRNGVSYFLNAADEGIGRCCREFTIRAADARPPRNQASLKGGLPRVTINKVVEITIVLESSCLKTAEAS